MAVVPESNEKPHWLVRPGVVRSCIEQLLSQRIHPLFSAYLCLKRVSFRERRTGNLRPDWNECFGTFFMVPGDPDERPYFRPFWNEPGKVDQAWLNRNLAGSFAASSIRPGTAFTRVVEINAGPTTYSLLGRHWELARLHLTDNKQVPALPLAAFLYRDFGLNRATVPGAADLVRVFRAEFGYQSGSDNADGQEQFDHLFVDNSPSVDVTDWFESVVQA